jgi:hypothetical protein
MGEELSLAGGAILIVVFNILHLVFVDGQLSPNSSGKHQSSGSWVNETAGSMQSLRAVTEAPQHIQSRDNNVDRISLSVGVWSDTNCSI